MGKDSYKRLMDIFARMIKNQRSEIVNFADINDPDLEKVITVHPNEQGNLVISVFSPEQWMMVQDVCLMTRQRRI